MEIDARAQLKKSTLANVKISRLYAELGMFPANEFNDFCDELCMAIQGEKFQELTV